MKMKRAVQLTIFCLTMASCATAPKFAPTYFDKSVFFADTENISVLPLVDIRKDKSLVLSKEWPHDAFTAYKIFLGRKIPYILPISYFKEEKGYEATLAADYGEITIISEDDILDADPSWIKRLGSSDNKWMLLLVLEDTAIRKTFGTAGTAECSGYLFDKNAGKLLWKHEATGEISMLGLAGYIASEHAASDAVLICFGNIYEQFPKRHS